MPVSLPYSPARHYRLDSIAGGTTATDLGLQGQDGTIQGTESTDWQAAGGLTPNSGGSFQSLTTSGKITATTTGFGTSTPMTIAIIINPTSTPSGFQIYASEFRTGPFQGISIQAGDSGLREAIKVFVGGGTLNVADNLEVLTDAAVLSGGQSTFVAVTYDGSLTEAGIKIYGADIGDPLELLASTPKASGSPVAYASTGQQVCINGRDNNGLGGGETLATYDEAALWSSVLTLEQLRNVYAAMTGWSVSHPSNFSLSQELQDPLDLLRPREYLQ